MNYSNLKQHECKGRYFLPRITASIITNRSDDYVLTHPSDIVKFSEDILLLYYDYIPFHTIYKVSIKYQLDKKSFEVREKMVFSLNAAMRFINVELTKFIDYHVNK